LSFQPIVLFKLRAVRRNSADWIVPHVQSRLRRLPKAEHHTIGWSWSRMAIHGVMGYSRNGQAVVFGWKRGPTENQCLSGKEALGRGN
jgi:hypothetical protein